MYHDPSVLWSPPSGLDLDLNFDHDLDLDLCSGPRNASLLPDGPRNAMAYYARVTEYRIESRLGGEVDLSVSLHLRPIDASFRLLGCECRDVADVSP